MTPSVGWLPFLAAFTLAFAVFTYVVLDGTDLGVGILFAAHRKDRDREVMVDSILPVWDGNETWLVLGGGSLIGMFPIAYSALLTALYPVLIVMLMALIFRGVTVEFRSRASNVARPRWDKAMLGGSVLASFCQGIALGAFIKGIRVENSVYAGGWWDWLSPFSILCGVALVVGYALLGSCWLVWRTEGELQQRARRHARILMRATIGFIIVVSVWTPFLNPLYRERWFSWPNIVLASPVPILLAVCAWVFWRTLSRGREVAPLIAALACFLMCYAGFGVTVYPDIIPPSLTIAQAASARSSEIFALVGAAILIPAILAYSTYSFWIFRGKVKPKDALEPPQKKTEEPGQDSPALEDWPRFRIERAIGCRIREETEQRAAQLALHRERIPHRLEQLDREWDVQQAVTVSATILGVAGTVLGIRRNRAYFVLPGLAAIFLVQQARQGWCPLYPVLRGLRFRSVAEIEQERVAVEALRPLQAKEVREERPVEWAR